MPRLRSLVGACLIALVGASIAACGSSSNSSSTTSSSSTTAPSTPAPAAGAGQTLNLTADPTGAIKFDRTSLSAKAGTVTLRLANPSSSGLEHGIGVQGKGVDKDGAIVEPGGTSSVTVTLKPGSYTFYCPVAEHRQAGMQGTLKVT